jgi:hypothetical protein
MGTWIVVSAGESYEILSADWFGKPSNNLELSLCIHIPSSRVTLLLRLGTTVSMVWQNVLGLHPVDVLFYKRQVISVMVSFVCVFIFAAY